MMNDELQVATRHKTDLIMKMALSEFVLRKKGIYGILHVIILLLSLFLVISISIDTFKGIPFYEQSVYMEVQWWI